MIPKKPKLLYKQVAEEMNISEVLVDNFMTFYYKEIRKNLSELNYTKINIDGLGVMAIKPRTVDGLINKYKSKIERLTTDTISNYHFKKRLEDRVELLLKTKEMLEFDKQVKEDFLKNKQDGKTREDLGE
jgi:nucleoid DNA-binding protein